MCAVDPSFYLLWEALTDVMHTTFAKKLHFDKTSVVSFKKHPLLHQYKNTDNQLAKLKGSDCVFHAGRVCHV